MKKIKAFFKGVAKEAKKTRWPHKKEMIKYSGATLVLLVFFAAFFYLLDVVFAFVKGWF